MGPAAATDYTQGVDDGVSGLRVGLLREGFGRAEGLREVDECVRSASQQLVEVGAEVVEVSVPDHAELAPAIWSVILTDGAARQMIVGNGYGMNWRGRYSPSVVEHFGESRRTRFDLVSPAVQFATLTGQYTAERFDGRHYAKAQNLALDLRAAYDAVLGDVDLLCMPTSPMTATPTPPRDAPLTEYILRTIDMMRNTSPFDTTGHPAISVPAGFVDGLPVGLMLVGKHFDEPTILRAARAFEAAVGGFPKSACGKGGACQLTVARNSLPGGVLPPRRQAGEASRAGARQLVSAPAGVLPCRCG
jgi:amidase